MLGLMDLDPSLPTSQDMYSYHTWMKTLNMQLYD